MNNIIVFDLSGTLAKMRPPRLIAKKYAINRLHKFFELGIITGARRAEAENILSKLEIRNYFDLVVTKDDSKYRKPDRRILEMVKKRFDGKTIIYIGDTKKDYQFARSAKIDFYYVGKRKYGIYQNPDINKVIDFIVKNRIKCYDQTDAIITLYGSAN